MTFEEATTLEIKNELKVWQKHEGVDTVRAIGADSDSCVLDFGCGDGHFTIAESYACPKGKVIGGDIDKDVLNILNDKINTYNLKNLTTVILPETGSLPFEDKTFDLITVNDLIHEFPDTSSIITRLKRVLKDSGILAISPFHMTDDEIRYMVFNVSELGFVLVKTVKNGGIHFGKVTKVNGAWKRLSDFERADIFCFKKSKKL